MTRAKQRRAVDPASGTPRKNGVVELYGGNYNTRLKEIEADTLPGFEHKREKWRQTLERILRDVEICVTRLL